MFVLELRNTADGPRQATYVVTVTAESVEFEATKRRTVEIPAGGTQTVEFTFDVSFDDWADGGGVDFQRANDAAE